MLKHFFLLCLASFALGADSAPATAPATAPALPPALQQFREKIAGMGAKEILAAATKQFGPPTRDIGSGLRIPQWDIAGGVLTVHPSVGPSFTAAQGTRVWLLPTRNLAEENLLRGFEMTTPPDPANHGNRFWIGNIRIAADKTYKFTDSGANKQHRGDQSKNFFAAHPAGRVEIIWADGVDAKSELETIGERNIARFKFIASDDKTEFTSDVASSPNTRRLSISGASFVAGASWRHFWPENGGKPDKD